MVADTCGALNVPIVCLASAVKFSNPGLTAPAAGQCQILEPIQFPIDHANESRFERVEKIVMLVAERNCAQGAARQLSQRVMSNRLATIHEEWNFIALKNTAQN